MNKVLELLSVPQNQLESILSKVDLREDYLKSRDLSSQTICTAPFWQPWYSQLFSTASHLEAKFTLNSSYKGINLASSGDLTAQELSVLPNLVKTLSPWRKGPFQIGDLIIDAEWDSEIKWDRLKPFLPELKGKVVADVGCNNGYYMYRMLNESPKFIMGFDPFERYIQQFLFLQYLCPTTKISIDLLSDKALEFFVGLFDCILCAGVYYHHKNPRLLLERIYTSLNEGGTAIIEGFVLPDSGEKILVPEDRYSKLRNVWFIPSVTTLSNLMLEVGFKDLKISDALLTTTTEQRRTEFMQYESLTDFLDPNDPTKTVEGYPAPRRVIIRGEKTKSELGVKNVHTLDLL